MCTCYLIKYQIAPGPLEQPMSAIPRSIADALVGELRTAIVAGEFRPGQRLTIDELSERFQVSATPVRTALAQLNAEGLVRTEPHRGAMVSLLTADDICDIFEVRISLEAMATRLAVPQMREEHVAELERLAWEMSTTENLAASVGLNNEFHLRLYEPCRRPYLLQLIGQSRLRVQHYMRWVAIDDERLHAAHDEHHQIVTCCRQGDAEGAAQLIEGHIRAVVAHVAAGATELTAAASVS
jgi:DNA-binding GntR family transcriptional regulator